MMAAVSATLAERTGRSLEQWVEAVRAEAATGAFDVLDQKAVRAWLKSEHGMAQNPQWAVADAAARAAGWEPPTVEEYTDAMYTGKKAEARPLHDAVVEAACALGDVEPQGRGTYIPLVHHSQFVTVGPGSYGRLKVGFRFRDAVPEDARLEPAKGFAQATHVIQVAPVGEDGAAVDPAELARSLEPLLRAAWEQN